jgi:hypothetical protein
VPADAVTLEAGDVVVPMISHRLAARVVTDAESGALLGSHLYLIRPDTTLVDPWFLAGFLRRETNIHRTGSLGSVQRYDVRKARIPRIPIAEQRPYADLFRRLADFDILLHTTAQTGGEMMRLVADGLAAGAIHPSPTTKGT